MNEDLHIEHTERPSLTDDQLERVTGGTLVPPKLVTESPMQHTEQGVWVREVVEDVEAY